MYQATGPPAEAIVPDAVYHGSSPRVLPAQKLRLTGERRTASYGAVRCGYAAMRMGNLIAVDPLRLRRTALGRASKQRSAIQPRRRAACIIAGQSVRGRRHFAISGLHPLALLKEQTGTARTISGRSSSVGPLAGLHSKSVITLGASISTNEPTRAASAGWPRQDRAPEGRSGRVRRPRRRARPDASSRHRVTPQDGGLR